MVVRAHWSPESQNEAVLSKFPKIKGILLDKTGTLLHSQNTGQLEDGRKSYDLRKFTAYLKEWAPPEKLDLNK